MKSHFARALSISPIIMLLMAVTYSRAGAVVGEERDAGCSPLYFMYDTYLGHTLVCERVPEQQALPGTPDWQAHPSYLKMQFSGYPFPNELGLGPTIYIFQIEDNYRSLYPGGQSDLWLTQIDALRTVLRDKPAWATPSWQAGQPLTEPPLLPIVNAGNIYLAKQKYITVGRIAGVRYLAQITQQTAPPSRADTFYIFEGITDNDPYYGQSYITAVFPAFLASPPAPLATTDFQSQVQLIVNAIDRANSSAFNPDLRLFDNIVTSFKVIHPLPILDGGPGMPISGTGNAFDPYVAALLMAALLTMCVGITLRARSR